MTFSELYNTYVNTVFSYLNFRIKDKHLVEDIIQETFVSIYKDFSKLGNIDNMKAYILRIAHRRMVDSLRKIKSDDICIDDLNKEASYEDNPLSSLFISELFKTLDQASKDILYGVYVEGLSYKELSSILDIPEGTVKSKCYYAKKKLKEEYKEVT